VVGAVTQDAKSVIVKYSLDPTTWKGSLNVRWFDDTYSTRWNPSGVALPTNVNAASGTLSIPPGLFDFNYNVFYLGIEVWRGKNEFGSDLGSDLIRIAPFFKSGSGATKTLTGGTLLPNEKPPPQPLTLAPTVAAGTARHFILLGNNTDTCPTAYVKIADEETCKKAASAAGTAWGGVDDEANWPTGCYKYTDRTNWVKVYLNRNPVGLPSRQAQPLCISQ